MVSKVGFFVKKDGVYRDLLRGGKIFQMKAGDRNSVKKLEFEISIYCFSVFYIFKRLFFISFYPYFYRVNCPCLCAVQCRTLRYG